MQNMMNNLMGDMFKNVGDMKDMDPTKIGLQILDFQKSAFNNTYNAMLQIQQQTEKMVEPLLKNNPAMPEGWNSMLKKNQDDMKKTIDENFIKAESYLSSAGSSAKTSKSAAADTSKAKAPSK